MNKKQLWLRLENYHFEYLVPPHLLDQISQQFGGADAFTKAFAAKIARKLGWSKRGARQAIDEYKKFVFLGVISDFAVTPPKIIDQVWHEHILFTKGYRYFCEKIIGYPFEHNPELVSSSDQTGIYNAQYQDTLELYRQEFNREPPPVIWGITKFDEASVAAGEFNSRKKPAVNQTPSSDTTGIYDAPLYTYFDTSEGRHSNSHGSGGSWDSGGHGHHSSGSDSSGHHVSDSDFSGHGDNGGDSGGHGGDGGGDSSGDGGGGDGGGSCSSGCSGCGGGD